MKNREEINSREDTTISKAGWFLLGSYFFAGVLSIVIFKGGELFMWLSILSLGAVVAIVTQRKVEK